MNVCVFMLFDIGWYMSKYNKLLCKKKMALWEEYERNLYYLFKLAVSMFIGFFMTPFYLLYCIYRLVRTFV